VDNRAVVRRQRALNSATHRSLRFPLPRPVHRPADHHCGPPPPAPEPLRRPQLQGLRRPRHSAGTRSVNWIFPRCCKRTCCSHRCTSKCFHSCEPSPRPCSSRRGWFCLLDRRMPRLSKARMLRTPNGRGSAGNSPAQRYTQATRKPAQKQVSWRYGGASPLPSVSEPLPYPPHAPPSVDHGQLRTSRVVPTTTPERRVCPRSL